MADIFDEALLKRFLTNGNITTLASDDSILILDQSTGVILRVQISLLTSTLNGSLSGADIRSKLGITTLSGSNTGDETTTTILNKIGDGSKVSSAYLPSYVDDVLEYANLAALPGTGETGKIYITLDNNFEYRWSGSTYVRLVASPGTTDALTEGVTNLYFTNARALAAAPAETVTTSGALINGATAKTTPVDADMFGVMDSAASNVLKKLSWANIKATLKTYFDTLYANKNQTAWVAVSTFYNSWSNWGTAPGGYADASYFKDEFGLVHLRGLIKDGGIGSTAFILPVGFRPEFIKVYSASSSGSYATLRVNPDGSVVPYTGLNGYFSLDDIIFRAV